MRASKAPDKWQLVLDALSLGDEELANKLVIKYQFDKDSPEHRQINASGYTYVAKDTEDKVYSSTNASELSRRIGKVSSYVNAMITKRNGSPVSSGDFKGWVFWKEK